MQIKQNTKVKSNKIKAQKKFKLNHLSKIKIKKRE